MNLLMYPKRRCKPQSSLMFFSRGMYLIAFIFGLVDFDALMLDNNTLNFLDMISQRFEGLLNHLISF